MARTITATQTIMIIRVIIGTYPTTPTIISLTPEPDPDPIALTMAGSALSIVIIKTCQQNVNKMSKSIQHNE